MMFPNYWNTAKLNTLPLDSVLSPQSPHEPAASDILRCPFTLLSLQCYLLHTIPIDIHEIKKDSPSSCSCPKLQAYLQPHLLMFSILWPFGYPLGVSWGQITISHLYTFGYNISFFKNVLSSPFFSSETTNYFSIPSSSITSLNEILPPPK